MVGKLTYSLEELELLLSRRIDDGLRDFSSFDISKLKDIKELFHQVFSVEDKTIMLVSK